MLLSALNALVKEITAAMRTMTSMPRPDRFKHLSIAFQLVLASFTKKILEEREDADKNAAYYTLYTALVTVAKLIAPAMPFIADELYRNLVCSVDPNAMESVHMADCQRRMRQ
jgi:isoleucyl-tRNA synthetase